MHFLAKFSVIVALATQALATTASFDDLTNVNKPIGVYKSATWSGLILAQSTGNEYQGQPKPQSGNKMAMTQQASSGSTASTASFVFQHTGYLTEFYYFCYSANAASPIAASCEMTVTGQCADDTGTYMTLHWSGTFAGKTANMKKSDLSGATVSKPSVGSIRCSSYTFSAVPSGDSKTPVGFYLDDVTYKGVLQA